MTVECRILTDNNNNSKHKMDVIAPLVLETLTMCKGGRNKQSNMIVIVIVVIVYGVVECCHPCPADPFGQSLFVSDLPSPYRIGEIEPLPKTPG